MLRQGDVRLPHRARVPVEGRARGGARRILRHARPLHARRPDREPVAARQARSARAGAARAGPAGRALIREGSALLGSVRVAGAVPVLALR